MSVGNSNGSRTLATYVYQNRLLARQNYGSSGTNYVEFTYDSLDRLTKKTYNGDETKYVQYLYDPNGNQYGVVDSIWGKSTFLDFDLASRINGVATVDTSTKITRAYEAIRYNDGKGTIKSLIHIMFGSDGSRLSNTEYSYTYGNVSIGQIADTLYEYKIGTTDKFTFTYDDLARLTSRTLSTSETSKTENYTYKASEKYSGYTTTLVESMTDLSGVFHTYVYDANGNITEECVGDQTIRYEYDSQNRLTHYFDPIANKTRVYVYDDRGNILKVRYANYMSSEEWDAFVAEYGEDTLPSTPYTYGDSTWADLLTNYNGTAITYDEIGNPLTWVGSRGITLTWQNGRQLARYKQGTKTYDYTYNADGLRTGKTLSTGSSVTKSTEYYIVNGQYIGEVTNVGGTEYVISYIYDENGSPAGINVDGSTYYFAKNLQGDVVAILDSTGAIVAKYVYDAWGNIVSIIGADGNAITPSTHVAKLNPFRYRGYMYDEETGFYYLRSRYYDPGVGRFLNADGLVSTGQGFDGHNMFAYCNNNPVMLTDFSGTCASENERIDCGTISICKTSQIALKQSIANSQKCACGFYHCAMYSLLYRIKTATHYPVNSSIKPTTYGGHDALDFGALEGSNIYAVKTGRIKTIVNCYDNSFKTDDQGTSSWGNYVLIEALDGTEYLYAHMQQAIPWDEGDFVYAGEVIGSVGSTGRTYKNVNGEWVLGYPHLHFEIRKNGKKIPQDEYPWETI